MQSNIAADELYHYGVKGMKWGVRKDRNPDGSLTDRSRAKYEAMSGDKLQRHFNKQIKKARKEQYDFADRFNWRSTIGKNSEEVLSNNLKKRRELENSKEAKAFHKKLNSIDRKYMNDPDKYDKEWEKARSEFNNTPIGKELLKYTMAKSTKVGEKGFVFIKEYANGPGKSLSTAYLKDLGYDDAGAKYIAELLAKKNRSIGF